MTQKKSRFLMIYLISCLLVWVLFSTHGRAQEQTSESMNNVLNVSCDQCIAENEYMLLVLTKGADYTALSAKDIIFIDQLKADENGVVSISFVSHSFSECTILTLKTGKSIMSTLEYSSSDEPDQIKIFLIDPDTLAPLQTQVVISN